MGPLALDDRVKAINDRMMFSMPYLGMDPAIILGATRATALVAKEAFCWGHEKFIVVGGKPVSNENPAFTAFLEHSLKQARLPRPKNLDMTEAEYGRQVLMQLGVRPENIILCEDDKSTNLQQNLEVLKAHGFDKQWAAEFYTLAGTARRVLATTRKVWGDYCVLSAHNAFPPGVSLKNWSENQITSYYVQMEEVKIAQYTNLAEPEKGFCLPIDLGREIHRGRVFQEATRIGRDGGPVFLLR